MLKNWDGSIMASLNHSAPTNCFSVIGTPNHQTENMPTQVLKNKTLRFQPRWYTAYSWLHFETKIQKILCFKGLKAIELGLTPSANHEATFTSTDFFNWKKAIEKFDNHQKSDFHKHSVEFLSNMETSDIAKSPRHAAHKSQIEARNFLKVLFTSVMFLGKQGLALRGDDHDDGNFMQLLRLRATDIPGFSSWLNRSKSFSSWAIQNEILELTSHALLRSVMQQIQKAKYYSIIFDETTDASVSEQVSINIRVVSNQLEPQEFL